MANGQFNGAAHYCRATTLFDAGVIVAAVQSNMIRFDARQAVNPYHPFFGACPADEIKNIEAWLTVVDGKVVYERDRLSFGQ